MLRVGAAACAAVVLRRAGRRSPFARGIGEFGATILFAGSSPGDDPDTPARRVLAVDASPSTRRSRSACWLVIVSGAHPALLRSAWGSWTDSTYRHWISRGGRFDLRAGPWTSRVFETVALFGRAFPERRRCCAAWPGSNARVAGRIALGDEVWLDTARRASASRRSAAGSATCRRTTPRSPTPPRSRRNVAVRREARPAGSAASVAGDRGPRPAPARGSSGRRASTCRARARARARTERAAAGRAVRRAGRDHATAGSRRARRHPGDPEPPDPARHSPSGTCSRRSLFRARRPVGFVSAATSCAVRGAACAPASMLAQAGPTTRSSGSSPPPLPWPFWARGSSPSSSATA